MRLYTVFFCWLGHRERIIYTLLHRTRIKLDEQNAFLWKRTRCVLNGAGVNGSHSTMRRFRPFFFTTKTKIKMIDDGQTHIKYIIFDVNCKSRTMASSVVQHCRRIEPILVSSESYPSDNIDIPSVFRKQNINNNSFRAFIEITYYNI